MSNEENDDEPDQASRKKRFIDRDAQGSLETLYQSFQQAPRPDLTEDEYLAEMMDRTPVMIFRAIDALTNNGKKVSQKARLEACEQAIDDLLRLIARREETGLWATHYDLQAVIAWKEKKLPTKRSAGRNLIPSDEVGFATLTEAVRSKNLEALKERYDEIMQDGQQKQKSDQAAEDLKARKASDKYKSWVDDKPRKPAKVPPFRSADAVEILAEETGIDPEELAEFIRGGKLYEKRLGEDRDPLDIVQMWRDWKQGRGDTSR
jgi:hypothetical protein